MGLGLLGHELAQSHDNLQSKYLRWEQLLARRLLRRLSSRISGLPPSTSGLSARVSRLPPSASWVSPAVQRQSSWLPRLRPASCHHTSGSRNREPAWYESTGHTARRRNSVATTCHAAG